jgi:hypothetical protein
MLLPLKPLRYVSYRILTWKLRDPSETTPILVACIATSVLLFFNLMLAVMVINVWRGIDLLPKMHRSNLEYVLVAAMLAVAVRLMYAAWIDEGKLAILSKEFSRDPAERDSTLDLLFWGYIVFSVMSPLVFAILWHSRQSAS